MSDINEQSEHQEPTVEERARLQGWVPKEEFRGDPERWVDAETFTTRGDNELPILRENLRRMERKYSQLEKTVQQFSDFASKAEERSYKRAYEQIKAEQRQAVTDGDVERFDAAQRQMEELQKDAATKQQPSVDEIPPDFAEWKSTNQWYDSDPEMTEYANAQGAFLGKTRPTLKGTAFYLEVEKRVRKEFPEKFENGKPSGGSKFGSVHGGDDADSVRSSGKGKRTYSDLPADAKAMCDRFTKTIPGYTREQYIKDYQW